MPHFWSIKNALPAAHPEIQRWYQNVLISQEITTLTGESFTIISASPLPSEETLLNFMSNPSWLEETVWYKKHPLYFSDALKDSLESYQKEKYEDVIFKTATRVEMICRVLYIHTKKKDVYCAVPASGGSTLNSYIKSLSKCNYAESLENYWKTVESYISWNDQGETTRNKVFHGNNPELNYIHAQTMILSLILLLQIDFTP